MINDKNIQKDHKCCCKDCECKTTPKCKKCRHTAKECDCYKCKCNNKPTQNSYSGCCGCKK